ncbi:MAG: hypothetical protein ABFE07_00805 [Armatimonadia bacterium]
MMCIPDLIESFQAPPWLTDCLEAKWKAGRKAHAGTEGDLTSPDFDFNVAVAGELLDVVLYYAAASASRRSTPWIRLAAWFSVMILSAIGAPAARAAAAAAAVASAPSPEGRGGQGG